MTRQRIGGHGCYLYHYGRPLEGRFFFCAQFFYFPHKALIIPAQVPRHSRAGGNLELKTFPRGLPQGLSFTKTYLYARFAQR